MKDKVDKYIALLDQEYDLKEQYETVKKERKELMEQLSEIMDSQGITQLVGTSGKKVSTVHKKRAQVEDSDVFKRYVIGNGLQDTYLKEVIVQKEINSVARDACKRAEADGYSGHPDDLMPPGLRIEFSTDLRVTKPKNNGSDFRDAGKSIIEILQGEVE